MLSKYLILCRPLLLLPLISTLGFPVHCRLPELAQTHVHQVCDPMFFICHEKQMGFHLFWKPNILCCPCLLLPSIFPQIRVFSSESALHFRWSKYWSFSFSISPSNKYSGLISFRIDWFDFLPVQETLKSLLQYHSSKASILQSSTIFKIVKSHYIFISFFLIFIFTLFYFTILYWFCHTLTWIHHGCTCIPKHFYLLKN